MSYVTNTGYEATYPPCEDTYDECVERENDEHDMACGTPRCGGRHWDEYDQLGGCPGCKHCDPVDHECKPYGFGIERFEDPALAAANTYSQNLWIGGPYHNQPCWPGVRMDARNRHWKENSKHSARRLKHSKLIWERLCDECDTHREAVERYKDWAPRAITIRYRDEKVESHSPPKQESQP